MLAFYWAVEYRKNGKTLLLLNLHKSRRLARIAAGSGKKPHYRAVKVAVQVLS